MKSLIDVELIELDDGQKQLKWVAGAQQSIATVEQLIEMLGLYRSVTMPPVRELDPEEFGMIQAVADPRWQLSLDISGAVIFQIRHPGFGWLAFRLPPASSSALLQQVSRAEARRLHGPGIDSPD